MHLATIRHFFDYSDWANGRVLAAAESCTDEELDRPMDIGPGSLRRVLIHTLNGEAVWLARWISGRDGDAAEVPWPPESEKASIAMLESRFAETWSLRDRFLDSLDPAALNSPQIYRDSKGSLFSAPLGEMIHQSIIHSIHHRAQAVNILRRLGSGLVELDYMMSRRQPVQTP